MTIAGRAGVAAGGALVLTGLVAPDDAVQAVLRTGRPTVAEFGANACASCREMKPVLAALRREHGERIAVVDVDLIAQKEADYIRRYRIQLMPTQIFFDAQGRETSRNMGKISREETLARLQVPAVPAPQGARCSDRRRGPGRGLRGRQTAGRRPGRVAVALARRGRRHHATGGAAAAAGGFGPIGRGAAGRPNRHRDEPLRHARAGPRA
jgi:thioredoxin 1